MKRIITISREFGSAGRTIGKKLAEKLGYAYYDKELVDNIAAETGFDPGYIEEHAEYSATASRLSYFFSTPPTAGVMRGMSTADFLWCIQREVILKIADEKPCVIVGRCADYILRDRDDVFNVFVCAPIQVRADRIVRLYGESEKKPEERLRDKDKRRANNYKHYTEREWGKADNYDLCLNTGKLDIDTCVELIAGLVK